MLNRIQIRRDTPNQWTSVNPILAQGELGIELNISGNKIKIGNGINHWSELSYFGGGGGESPLSIFAESPISYNNSTGVISHINSDIIRHVTDTQIGNWNTAYEWGTHTGLYSLFNHGHITSDVTGLDTTLSNKQPLNSRLTSITELNDNAGFLVQTNATTVVKRTLVDGTGISITHKAGAAGNPTITNTDLGSSAVNTHLGVTDPHGDRAYADLTFAPIGHSNDSTIHVTSTDKTTWNSKQDGTGYISRIGELGLVMTGDQFTEGCSMFLRNRIGAAGAIFQNNALPLVDFGFVGTASGVLTKQGNLRYETRVDFIDVINNPNGELQWLDNATDLDNFKIAMRVGKGKIYFDTAMQISGLVTLSNLQVSQIVETNASKDLISVAKGTAYNKAFGTTAGTVTEGNDSRLSDARTPTSHVHGNITNAGLVGTTANLPLITGTGGIIQAGSFGTAVNTFCQGNDSRVLNGDTAFGWGNHAGLYTLIAHTGATGTAHGAVTTSVDGFMSSTDKSKLDGIATSANNYAHPTGFSNQPSTALINADVISQVSVNSEGHVTGVISRALTPVNIGAEPSFTKNSAFNKNFGADVDTVCQGNDSRLSDSRTPTTHIHGNITNEGYIGTTANLVLQTGTDGIIDVKAAGTNSQFLRGDGSWAAPYTVISEAEITAGTATNNRNISGARAAFIAKRNAGTSVALAHGVAAVGISDLYAREDHVHPSDNVNTASAVSDILEGSNVGTEIKYTPYATSQASLLKFYTHATNPTGTDRLNIGGYFYATRLYDGGTRVSVEGHNHDAAYAPIAHVGATGTAHGAVTTSVNGFMIAADKTKLDGIDNNANNYTHPVNHLPSIITQDSNNRFVTDTQINTWNGKQDALTNPVTGTGTVGRIARFTDASTITGGVIQDDGVRVIIHTIKSETEPSLRTIASADPDVIAPLAIFGTNAVGVTRGSFLNILGISSNTAAERKILLNVTDGAATPNPRELVLNGNGARVTAGGDFYATNIFENNTSLSNTYLKLNASNGNLTGNLGIHTAPETILHVRNTTTIGGVAGNEQLIASFASVDANNTRLRIKGRRFATGTDHNTSESRLQRIVDSSEFTYVGLRNSSVSFGTGATEWMNIDNSQLLVTGNISEAGTLLSSKYQAILTNPVTGTGTLNRVARFTDAGTIGNGIIRDDGSRVIIIASPVDDTAPALFVTPNITANVIAPIAVFASNTTAYGGGSNVVGQGILTILGTRNSTAASRKIWLNVEDATAAGPIARELVLNGNGGLVSTGGNLNVGGTLTIEGRLNFGLLTYTGERGQALSAGQFYSYGNGVNNSAHTICIPAACVLVGIAWASQTAITTAGQLEVYKNEVATGVTLTLVNGQNRARAWGLNSLTFDANDRVNIRVNSGAGGTTHTATMIFRVTGN